MLNPVCQSYRQGHQTHWIPVLRVYADTPTIQVQVEPNGKGAFTVTTVGKRGAVKQETLYFHNPVKLRNALRKVTRPDQVQRVKGTTFIKVHSIASSQWFYMSDEPVSECIYDASGPTRGVAS